MYDSNITQNTPPQEKKHQNNKIASYSGGSNSGLCVMLYFTSTLTIQLDITYHGKFTPAEE